MELITDNGYAMIMVWISPGTSDMGKSGYGVGVD